MNGIRRYILPIVACTLMLLALLAWETWDWTRGREQFSDRTRRHSSGIFDTMRATLLSLQHDSRFSSTELNTILSNILRNTPLEYVAIFDSTGNMKFSTGRQPAGFQPTPQEGEFDTESAFILCREVKIPANAGGGSTADPGGSDDPAKFDLDFPGNTFSLMLGFGKPKPPHWDFGQIKGLIVIGAFGALFIFAFAIAWIMSIRSGQLSSALDLERARSAHLEDLNLIAAGLAHETKNPLGIISALSQSIRREPGLSEESVTMCEQINDEVDRATSRLGDFMAFARRREPKMCAIDPSLIAEDVSELISVDLRDKNVNLFLDIEKQNILADEDMFRQILVNLIMNSQQAVQNGGKVTIRFQVVEGTGRLVIEDNGKGISPDLLPNIFKPYVSGQSSGHGLGLAIVHRFITQHNWSIRADSTVGEGTKITISGIQLSETTSNEP